MNREISLTGAEAGRGAWHSAGAWVFRHRSWLPVPTALVLLLVRKGEAGSPHLLWLGPAVVLLGEAVRMWSVRQIGVISRTRAARSGPLVITGPFAIVRNPIYVGNFLLWTGFVLWSRLLWMIPIAWLLFTLQHKAIVRWEEGHLAAHFGQAYRDYAAAVPRWWPRFPVQRRELDTGHPWSEIFFSERGTLLAIIVVGVLMTAKAVF